MAARYYRKTGKNPQSLMIQRITGSYLYDLNRVRTCDPYPVKIVLSQLSYQIVLATINNIAG